MYSTVLHVTQRVMYKNSNTDRRMKIHHSPQTNTLHKGRTGSSNRPWLSRQTGPISNRVTKNSGVPSQIDFPTLT